MFNLPSRSVLLLFFGWGLSGLDFGLHIADFHLLLHLGPAPKCEQQVRTLTNRGFTGEEAQAERIEASRRCLLTPLGVNIGKGKRRCLDLKRSSMSQRAPETAEQYQ